MMQNLDILCIETYTSDVNSSDIKCNDLQDTNNMEYSDDSIQKSSFDSNLNEATGLDDDFLSSISCNESYEENINVDRFIHKIDNILSSTVDKSQLNDKTCAVKLCNENVRNQFDNSFFINFPKHNKLLCDKWWKLCGHNDKFDPFSKICSIHFDADNFKTISKKRDKLYHNNVLKNSNTVPTFYLLPHEYFNFSNEQKKININGIDNYIIIPKSKNNGNVDDYIYLDVLNSEDVGKFLSFEKKYITKNSKNEINKLMEINRTNKVPESIIYNENLRECYGKILPPYCDSNCQLQCYYYIPDPQRKEIYKEFQILRSVLEQNCKITELVQLRTIKKENNTFESSPLYNFILNKKSVKVCQTFFINTLGISKLRINAILEPVNYSWYSDRETALKSNQSNCVKIISEPNELTDFVKESLKMLEENDYNVHESESYTEDIVDDLSSEECEKVIKYIKSVPRVLSSCKIPGEVNRQFFETSINYEYMYKTYSENYIKENQLPPCNKRQFKKIYNKYMKTFLKVI